uniref:S8 family peptidase n=1 Tax=Bordetella sputigena TaxID=1416810 RepID=UPI0039F08E5C
MYTRCSFIQASSMCSKIVGSKAGNTGQCTERRRSEKKPAWRLSAWRNALFSGVLLPSLAGAMEMPNGFLPADQFRTDEYRASWALEKIHAADAYALGYSGKGVRIGVVDSGDVLDHAEFAGRTGPWIQSGPPNTEPFDEVGAHSTYVSGVLAAARDGRGMHGVAYDAALIPITGWGVKTYEDHAEVYFQTAGGIADAVQRGAQIINGSYGPPVLPSKNNIDGQLNPKYRPQSMQMLHFMPELNELQFFSDEVKALRYAAAHDVVVVYAAGNHFGDHPDAAAHPSAMGLLPYIKPGNHGSGVYRIVEGELILEDEEYGPDDYVTIAPSDSRLKDLDFSDVEQSMIVVVATDKDDRITSYSNRCGVAWRWCIAAPGGDKPGDGESWESTGMYTTTLDQGYGAVRMRGTSLAAPLV